MIACIVVIIHHKRTRVPILKCLDLYFFHSIISEFVNRDVKFYLKKLIWVDIIFVLRIVLVEIARYYILMRWKMGTKVNSALQLQVILIIL